MREVENGALMLHEAGLIFEINRVILHPLGLALGFEAEEDGTVAGGIRLFDFGEPTAYASNPERDAARESALARFRASRPCHVTGGEHRIHPNVPSVCMACGHTLAR